MPRRNRNAAAIRPDTDQLAAELAQLAADLHHTVPASTSKGGLLFRYFAHAINPGFLLPATGARQQPIPQLVPGSR